MLRDLPTNLRIRLTPGDPHPDLNPILKRQPEPRVTDPPPHEQITPNPAYRLLTTPNIRHDHPRRLTRPQTLLDHLAIRRRQPPIRPANPSALRHHSSNRSTLNTIVLR